MGNTMGSKKTVKEQLRENKRQINRAIRELDRERANLQLQEKKTVIEIKKLAKEGQLAAVKVMAKDIVRIRQHVEKFYSMRSQLQAVSLRLESVRSAEAMTSALQGTTSAMKSMASTMNLPRLNQILREYTKESEKMEMTQEMLGETIDDAIDTDQNEEQEDQIVDQILDEIGIDLTGAVPEAPSAKTISKANKNEKTAAPIAAMEQSFPASMPSVSGANLPTQTNISSDASRMQSDVAMQDLEARLHNLRQS
ncbi:unnamed protein product [Albugo candida]|uniref:Charged multivesicular body protein 2a n=1 Tax=Albugo candida TaxID=65357 RepID=A0A024G445_9STRA|nr:unnamed protein product [Albugo candida]|eukprot:CCI41634.1 unnamed protein product [Albugo candida]